MANAACADCLLPYPLTELLFLEAIGFLCGWCLRWRRLDEFAARAS